MRKILFLAACFFFSTAFAQQQKKILVVTEGSADLSSPSYGVGRQLIALLGHFSAAPTLVAVRDYTPGLIEKYDYIFENE